MFGFRGRGRGARAFGGRPRRGDDFSQKYRSRAIGFEGTVAKYTEGDYGDPGVFMILDKRASPHFSYYEIEIVDRGTKGRIGLGLAHRGYPLCRMPGWEPQSVGYHADDGRLFHENGMGEAFGPTCFVGDRMGCGIEFDDDYDPADEDDEDDDDESDSSDFSDSPEEFFDDFDVYGRIRRRQMRRAPRTEGQAKVFFTKNGEKVGREVVVQIPRGGFFPAVGMHSPMEAVRVDLTATWPPDGAMDCIMATSDSEEVDGEFRVSLPKWKRLSCVQSDGLLLRYIGAGKSIEDVGLAQAEKPLGQRRYYFELEITDQGHHGYIAIGVARRDYPLHQHPGWRSGSVAYHADDGKLFHGNGTGQAFAPPCSLGDRMGCGIFFRPKERGIAGDWDDWQASSSEEDEDEQEEEEEEEEEEEDEDDDDTSSNASAESDEEDHDNQRVYVFFTRNGKMLGGCATRVPAGGFFPTVGMLSSGECVTTNLCPRTG